MIDSQNALHVYLYNEHWLRMSECPSIDAPPPPPRVSPLEPAAPPRTPIVVIIVIIVDWSFTSF
jgi:hypothetical protein